jgi:raffinose/stachyose/melibiose transport system permease protein
VRISYAVAVLPLALFVFVPAFSVLILSFTDVKPSPFLPVHWIGLKNYQMFFNAAHMADNLATLQNTLVYAVLLTVGQVGIGLALALLLNRKRPGSSFFRSLVFMPVILGVTISGLVWSSVLSVYGPVNELLAQLGLHADFFADPNIALYVCAFVAVWANVGVQVVIFIAGLQTIPVELYESAAIDGASKGQIFRNITFPLLAPSFTTNTLLGLIGSLQSYQMIYVLTGNKEFTKVFSLAVYFTAFGSGHQSVSVTQGYASCISMVQFVLVGIVALFALAILRRREAKL